MPGPLAGTRVLEVPGIGPLQYAGMLLADLGADVLRLDRATDVAAGSNVAGFVSPYSVIDRGRRSAGIDLKHPDAVDVVLRLCERADVLVEGFRPGVAERLGIGPDACRARNPRLVYGRMTGWGQDGPLASEPGHDLNYLALAGVLHHLGRADQPPTIPINLLADFAGGGALLVTGILAALVERATSGLGQVVDAAMVDGSAQLMSIFVGLDAMGAWGPRGTNLLDGGAHFYNVYETADGGYVSIASYEPKFYANLARVLAPLGVDLDPDAQMDREQWPASTEHIAALMRTRTRDEWVELFEGQEICFAPVLSMTEARAHRHNVARRTFVEVGGAPQPAPAPRLDRTPAEPGGPPVAAGTDTDTALTDWGFEPGEIETLKQAGTLA